MPVSCCWNPAQYSSLAAESRAATGRALKLSEALSSPLKPSSCSWSRECVGCAGGYFLHLNGESSGRELSVSEDGGGEVEGPGLPGCLAVAEITIAPRSRDRLVAIKCGRCCPALADHSSDGRRDTYQLRRSASDRGSEQHRDTEGRYNVSWGTREQRFPADRCQLDCVTATVRPHDWSAERRVDGRHHRESWLLVLKISKCSLLVPSYPNP